MELEKKLDELGKAWDEYKKINDQRLKEIEKNGKASTDVLEKIEKAEKDNDQLQKQVDEMKAALNRQHNGDGKAKTEEKSELIAKYKEACSLYMRKGIEVPSDVKEAAFKAMSVQSDEDGGFFVSPEMSSEIVKKVFESSPVRQLASVQTIGSDSLEILYDGDEVGSGWVGETQSRSETDTAQINKIIIPAHELYAKPKASQKLLDDANVNVEAWLSGKVTEKFARDEATAFINGSGFNKPKGILSYAATSEGFDKVQVTRTANATSLDGNDYIGVQSTLKEAYQMNASWLINRLIVGEIRKLKDTTSGQYIWQPGLTAGQPNMLLGKPVYFATDLDSTLAIDKWNAIYGDIRAGYQIVDRIGVRVLRDPYSAKPYVEFYTTKRVGGGVKDGDALKILQQKAS